MPEPQGHKLDRTSAEVKPVPTAGLHQKLTELMVLIESSKDSIGLVETEIQNAADEIRDRVSHFPKVFVDRFHQQLSEATAVLDVELAVRHLNQDLEKADATYRSIPKLPLKLMTWWQTHPQSTPISLVIFSGLIVFILTVPSSFIGSQDHGINQSSFSSDATTVRPSPIK